MSSFHRWHQNLLYTDCKHEMWKRKKRENDGVVVSVQHLPYTMRGTHLFDLMKGEPGICLACPGQQVGIVGPQSHVSVFGCRFARFLHDLRMHRKFMHEGIFRIIWLLFNNLISLPGPNRRRGRGSPAAAANDQQPNMASFHDGLHTPWIRDTARTKRKTCMLSNGNTADTQ